MGAWLLFLACVPLLFAPPAQSKAPEATRHRGAFSVRVPQGTERAALEAVFEPSQRTLTLRAPDKEAVAAHVIELPPLPSAEAHSELVRLAGGEHALVLRFGTKEPYVLVLLPPRLDSAASLDATLVLKGFLGGPAAPDASLDVVDSSEGQRLILSAAAEAKAGLCGRSARSARALDPGKGRFVRAGVPVLGAEERKRASKLSARTESADAPGVSVDIYLGPVPSAFETDDVDLPTLTDARWSAAAAPYEVVDVSPSAERPLEALVVRVSDGASTSAGSWDLWLLTNGAAFEVDTSEVRGAQSFVVDLPPNLRSGCLGLAVAVGAPFVEVAGRLKGPSAETSPRQASLQLLAGDLGLRELALVRPAAVRELALAYRSLEPAARVRAESLARLAEANDAEAFWVRQLIDGNEGERQRARARLQRRPDGGVSALARALGSAPAKDELILARVLAELSPTAALRPIASRLGQRSAARRLELRRVLAELSPEAPFVEEAGRFLLDPAVARGQKVEVARALVPVIAALEARARQEILALLKSASFQEAYVLVPVAVELSLIQPAAQEVLLHWLEEGQMGLSVRQLAALRTEVLGVARDREARAAWLSRLALGLLEDPFLRVRIAAAGYLELAPTVEASVLLQDRLRHDDWPGMREATLGSLSSLRPDPAQAAKVDAAMIRALSKDPVPSVRARAARSLDRLPRAETVAALRRSLTKDENAAVRAEAARALGLVCDHGSVVALTAAARGLSRGAHDEADVRLGLYAVTALARLGPADLDARLEPLTAKSVPGPLRARVESAIVAGRGGCATVNQR
jgi:hypothetical protein